MNDDEEKLNVDLEDLANSGADFKPVALSQATDFKQSKATNDYSKSQFIAIKVPLKSSIEVLDPNPIFEHYRSLCYDEEMIKAYRLNISITKEALHNDRNL